jgi:hypothetical protein
MLNKDELPIDEMKSDEMNSDELKQAGEIRRTR